MTPMTESQKNVENTTVIIQPTPPEELEFNRSTIEGLGTRVRITDTDPTTGLDLFCYVRCGPEDGSLVRQCRGVVFNGDKIVMRAFPYTVEFNHTEKTLIENNINPIFSKCSFFDSYEGTLIRMFYFSGKWYISTHRKLDAFRSKWASKDSFGSAFQLAIEAEMACNKDFKDAMFKHDNSLNTIERFQKLLDPAKQYMFLVRNNNENRIVCCSPNRPTFYHVGTFIDGQLTMTEDVHVPHPTEHNFSDVDELINYVKTVDIRHSQGVIIFTPDNKQYKVTHKDYQDLFNARGNEPSIKFRYLQVRMDKHMVDMLTYLYPHMTKTFDEYENTLFHIAKNIYQSYVDRYIRKNWVVVQPEEFNVIRACHSWHNENRETNRLSLNKTIEFLNKQSATNLNKMIKRYNMEQPLEQPLEQTNETAKSSE